MPVFGAGELVHQPVELLVGLELRVVLDDRQQAAERRRLLVGGRDRLFGRLRRQQPRSRVRDVLVDAFLVRAYPSTVSTRFGIRSLRRCSWFSTCAHCALMASSWPTNLLYEQPVSGSAASTTSKRSELPFCASSS